MKFENKLIIKLKDIEKPKCVNWSEKQISMIDSIIKNDGKLEKPIRISNDYKIIDGNHRYCILFEEYGEDFDTEVIKISVNKKLYMIMIYIMLPVLLPIGLFNIIFKK